VRRLPVGPIRIRPIPWVLAGVPLVAFGWTYPHFLETANPVLYLIAAPLGLLPCPTLAATIGCTLMAGPSSTFWKLALATAAFVYAAIGVFWLDVTIDVVLFAGAAALVADLSLSSDSQRHRHWLARPMLSVPMERNRARGERP